MDSDPDDEFEAYGSEGIWLHPSELGSLLPPAPAGAFRQELQLGDEERSRVCRSRTVVAAFTLFFLAALSVLAVSAVPAFPFLVALACCVATVLVVAVRQAGAGGAT